MTKEKGLKEKMTNDKNKMNKVMTIILAFLLTLGNASAQIAINSFDSNPDIIAPGRQVQVSLEYEVFLLLMIMITIITIIVLH